MAVIVRVLAIITEVTLLGLSKIYNIIPNIYDAILSFASASPLAYYATVFMGICTVIYAINIFLLLQGNQCINNTLNNVEWWGGLCKR